MVRERTGYASSWPTGMASARLPSPGLAGHASCKRKSVRVAADRTGRDRMRRSEMLAQALRCAVSGDGRSARGGLGRSVEAGQGCRRRERRGRDQRWVWKHGRLEGRRDAGRLPLAERTVVLPGAARANQANPVARARRRGSQQRSVVVMRQRAEGAEEDVEQAYQQACSAEPCSVVARSVPQLAAA